MKSATSSRSLHSTQARFIITPRSAANLLETQATGSASFVDRRTGRCFAELSFEVDPHFTDLVVKAIELTVFPAFRERGYGKALLGRFFAYLQCEANRRDEEIVLCGEITSRVILHVWESVARAFASQTVLHERAEDAAALWLFDEPRKRRVARSALVSALPHLPAQDRVGRLKKPVCVFAGIASLIEPSVRTDS